MPQLMKVNKDETSWCLADFRVVLHDPMEDVFNNRISDVSVFSALVSPLFW